MQETKYLTVDYYVLNKVSENIKEIIGVEKFGHTKTLIDTDEKLPDEITLKNVVILMS